MVPRALWRRLAIAGDIELGVDGADTFLYRSVPDHPVDRVLFWRGLQGWEAESLSVWARLARATDTICDVGANTGIYALIAAAANPAAVVLAFEPVPRVHDRLVQNIRRNGWQHRCHAIAAAVTDHSGQVDLDVPDRATPKSARLSDLEGRSNGAQRISVPAVRLDDLPETMVAERPLGLVKIDVEGAEDRVLAGMATHLETSRPAILLECLPEGPNEAITSLLKAQDYVFAHLLPAGPRPADRIIPDPGRRFRNYLARPRP